MATALTADSAQRQLIAAEPLVIVRAIVTAVTVTFAVTSRYRLPHTSRISRRASVLPSFASRWPLDFWPVQGRHAPSSTSRAPDTHAAQAYGACIRARTLPNSSARNSVGCTGCSQGSQPLRLQPLWPLSLYGLSPCGLTCLHGTALVAKPAFTAKPLWPPAFTAKPLWPIRLYGLRPSGSRLYGLVLMFCGSCHLCGTPLWAPNTDPRIKYSHLHAHTHSYYAHMQPAPVARRLRVGRSRPVLTAASPPCAARRTL